MLAAWPTPPAVAAVAGAFTFTAGGHPWPLQDCSWHVRFLSRVSLGVKGMIAPEGLKGYGLQGYKYLFRGKVPLARTPRAPEAGAAARAVPLVPLIWNNP